MGLSIKFCLKKIINFTTIALFSLSLGQGIASAQEENAINDLNQGSEIIRQAEISRFAVKGQLDLAKEQRDVVKTLCINDKLNQIDVGIRALKDNKFDLKMAINQKKYELASHKFIIISILRQKINQFRSESTQCISHEQGFVGETSVKSFLDNSIPENFSPEFEKVIVQPPICSSCFK